VNLRKKTGKFIPVFIRKARSSKNSFNSPFTIHHSYNKNAQSRNLFSFLKSMESFEKTFDEKTSIIISTNSEFYKYLKSMD